MKNLEQELLEVVKKNLPEQAAGELKTFIEQAQIDKKKLDETLRANQLFEKSISEYREKEVKYAEADKLKTEALAEKEKNKEESLQLKLKEKDLQIESLKQVKSDMFTIMQLFVKNPRSIDIMQHSTNENQAGYNNGAQWIQPQPISRYTEKRTEHTEEKDA